MTDPAPAPIRPGRYRNRFGREFEVLVVFEAEGFPAPLMVYRDPGETRRHRLSIGETVFAPPHTFTRLPDPPAPPEGATDGG